MSKIIIFPSCQQILYCFVFYIKSLETDKCLNCLCPCHKIEGHLFIYTSTKQILHIFNKVESCKNPPFFKDLPTSI